MKDVDKLAVGHRCLGGVGVLGVLRIGWKSGAQRALPLDLTGVEVEGVQHPGVRGGERFRTHDAVDRRDGCAFLSGFGDDVTTRLLSRFVADHRRDEDQVAPDDRRAPPLTRHLDVPDDVFGPAPCLGQRRVVCHDTGARTSELRPVVVGVRRLCVPEQGGQEYEAGGGRHPGGPPMSREKLHGHCPLWRRVGIVE